MPIRINKLNYEKNIKLVYTKKTLIIGLLGLSLFFLSYFSKELGICSRGATYCGDYSDYIAIYSVYSFAVLYSVVLYHFFEQNAKKNFTRVFSMVFAALLSLTIIAPFESGAFGVVPEKGPLTLVLIALYFILATGYFIVKYREHVSRS